LKLENILLTKNLICKIADLGSAEISTITGLSSISSHAHPTGHTPMYAAPELQLSSFSTATKASDMFSFGVIVELILSRSNIRTAPNTLDGIITELKAEQSQRNCAIIDTLGSIVNRLCCTDPKDRPSITDIQTDLNSVNAPSPDEVSGLVTDVLKNYTVSENDSSEEFNKPLGSISMPNIQGRDDWALSLQEDIPEHLASTSASSTVHNDDHIAAEIHEPPEGPTPSQPDVQIPDVIPSAQINERKSTNDRVKAELRRWERDVKKFIKKI